MIQSYIDEKYLVHFFNSLLNSKRFTDEAKQRESILDFFKSKTDLILETDFNNIINKVNESYSETATLLINQLTTDRNHTKIYLKQENKFRELKRLDIYSRLKSPFATFWLGNDYSYSIDKYENKNPYFFLTIQNDIEKWKLLSKPGNYYIASNVDRNSPDVFNRETFKEHSHSFKDIIISDHFSFQTKTGIEENIIPYIINLSSNKNMIENVLLFTENDKIYNNSLESTYKLIKKALEANGIYSNVRIHHSHNVPHGRYIFTNNNFMVFGNSIDIFDKNLELKSKAKLNDSTINIYPIFETNRTTLNSISKSLASIMNNESIKFHGTKSKNILDLIK